MNPQLAFLDGIGGPELFLIFVISLMLFGGKKLPELARGVGKSVREFKRAASGVEEEFRRAMDAPPSSPPVKTPPKSLPPKPLTAAPLPPTPPPTEPPEAPLRDDPPTP